MTEPQPEYVWAFPPEKPRGRLGLVIGLSIAAVVIAAAAVLLLLRPWESPAPTPAASPSTSASATPGVSAAPTPTTTPSTTPTPGPGATPAPTASAPVTTPPSAPVPTDPGLAVFRTKVQPLLGDAATGLDYAQDASRDEGLQIAAQLRDDAGRMSDMVAPRPIAGEWREGVQSYGRALETLRAAFDRGSSTDAAVASAHAALRRLNDLVSD